jgi:hypothetical protein
LQAFDAIAFLAHASYAAASFLAFGALGIVALSRHEDAPEVQLWIPSTVGEQSVFLLHAAACLPHALSMHWPQSLFPNAGAAGVDAAVDSGAALDELDVSAGAEDADAAGSGAEDSAVLADDDVSGAGLSAGLDSPPHAIQASGAKRGRAKTARYRGEERFTVTRMGSAMSSRIKAGNARRFAFFFVAEGVWKA